MLTLHLINIAVFIGFIFLTWKKPGIALVTLLPTAVGMFLSGLIYFDGEIVDAGLLISLLPVLLLPITICIIHWGPSSSELERPWYKAVTSMILAFLKYILILSVFVGVFQFFSPILFVLFLISVYQFAQARKFGLTMDVITAIGTSMRQSLPLPMALTTAAHGQKQREARIFNNIAHWLTQGWPLSEAMRRGYPRCPSNILASIASAEKMNQLPKAIESLNADLSEKINKCKIPQHVNLFYPFVVLTFMFSIMIGLSIFIVPTFAEVLWEMSEGKGALPAATQLLLELAKWILGRQGLNALTVVAIPSVIIFFSMYIKFRRRHPSNPGFISRIGDWIKWHTPVWHWFEKTFSNLYLVQIFHVGLAAGYPVNVILRNTMGLDVNLCYQNILRKWLKKIEAGENISQSAKACGLDKTLAWAFDEKINKGNTPLILEGLEDVYRHKYNYYKNVLASASWPLVILLLGLIVGWVVYAFFIAIVSLITFSLQYTIPQ